MSKLKPGRVYAFPNGSSFMAWEEGNCQRCKKSEFDPDKPVTCKLQKALFDAQMGDGSVKKDVVIKIGLKTADGKKGDYCCKQFELKKGELPDELQAILDNAEVMFDRLFKMMDVSHTDKLRFLRRLGKRSLYLRNVLKKYGEKK